jgi:hypothetical protein
MTLNEEWTHYKRENFEPIETNLFFILEGDAFEFQEEEEIDEIMTYTASIQRGLNGNTRVYLPITIGKGSISPDASYFTRDGMHVRDTYAASPGGGEDMRPLVRITNNNGDRQVEFDLDIDHLIDSGGNANYFVLNFTKIPYWKEDVTIQKGVSMAVLPDTIMMYREIDGVNHPVSKIYLPIEEDDVEPEPEQNRQRRMNWMENQPLRRSQLNTQRLSL